MKYFAIVLLFVATVAMAGCARSRCCPPCEPVFRCPPPCCYPGPRFCHYDRARQRCVGRCPPGYQCVEVTPGHCECMRTWD